MDVKQPADACGCHRRCMERLPGDRRIHLSRLPWAGQDKDIPGRLFKRSRDACREQRAYRNSGGPLLVVSLLGKAGWGEEFNGTPAQSELSRHLSFTSHFKRATAADCLWAA